MRPKTFISNQAGSFISNQGSGFIEIKVFHPKKNSKMTPNPTKEEIDALEREIERNRSRRNVRRAVNPRHEYDR